MVSREEIQNTFTGLQQSICDSIEEVDGKGKFVSDPWKRDSGGGGVSRIMTNGNVIEKGGVNFSAVWGKTPEQTLRTLGISSSSQVDFFATGVSIVMHPFNPHVPIIHMNVRYFEMSNGTWWFGGGIDLTPHYVDEADACHFHQTLQRLCNGFHTGYYNTFKAWADDYFYIKHRQESRGIGGIFFDHLTDTDKFTKETRFAFVKAVGEAFAPLYTYFMKKNCNTPFSAREKEWQHMRRGRYVEFNLLLDRGTKFGLETDGRTESILMSLPPQANWLYNFKPEPDSEEARTQSLLQRGIHWAE